MNRLPFCNDATVRPAALDRSRSVLAGSAATLLRRVGLRPTRQDQEARGDSSAVPIPMKARSRTPADADWTSSGSPEESSDENHADGQHETGPARKRTGSGYCDAERHAAEDHVRTPWMVIHIPRGCRSSSLFLTADGSTAGTLTLLLFPCWACALSPVPQVEQHLAHHPDVGELKQHGESD